MFSFCSLLETVLEAFHFDHKTLEKQLVTIDNQGELFVFACKNATSKLLKCRQSKFCVLLVTSATSVFLKWAYWKLVLTCLLRSSADFPPVC